MKATSVNNDTNTNTFSKSEAKNSPCLEDLSSTKASGARSVIEHEQIFSKPKKSRKRKKGRLELQKDLMIATVRPSKPQKASGKYTVGDFKSEKSNRSNSNMFL